MEAYPVEYKTKSAAGQINGSPFEYPLLGWGSPIPFVTQGYAVPENATIPIVGEGNTEPNDTYVDRAAQRRPSDPIELLLAEVWALRYTLLNLFHSKAKAASEGTHFLPDSIVKIRDQADTMKLQKAQKILADFLAIARANRVEK
jgi:hypothetical protein